MLVLSTGLLGLLADTFPTARITVVAGHLACSLFDGAPCVERVVPLRKQRYNRHWLDLYLRLIRSWDLVIDLRGSALAWMVPTRHRRIMNSSDPGQSRVVELGRLLDANPPPPPRLWIQERDRQAAAHLVPPDTEFLAVAPGASSPEKRWPPDRFAAMINRLTESRAVGSALAVVLLGAADERSLVESVRDRLRERPRRGATAGRAGRGAAADCCRDPGASATLHRQRQRAHAPGCRVGCPHRRTVRPHTARALSSLGRAHAACPARWLPGFARPYQAPRPITDLTVEQVVACRDQVCVRDRARSPCRQRLSRGRALSLGLDGRRADRICAATERWLVPLVPIALVSVSGVADVFCSVVAILFIVRAADPARRLVHSTSRGSSPSCCFGFTCASAVPSLRTRARALVRQLSGSAIRSSRLPSVTALSNDADRRRFVTVTVWSVLFLSIDAILQYCVGYDIDGTPATERHAAYRSIRSTARRHHHRVDVPAAAARAGGATAMAVGRGTRRHLDSRHHPERRAHVACHAGLDVVALLILLPHWRRQILIDGRHMRRAADRGDDRAAVDSTSGRSIRPGRSSPRSINRPMASSGYSDLAIASEYPIFGRRNEELPHRLPGSCFRSAAGAHDYPALQHPSAQLLSRMADRGWHSGCCWPLWSRWDCCSRPAGIRRQAKRAVRRIGRDHSRCGFGRWRRPRSFFHNWSAIPLFLTIGWALSYLPERALTSEQFVAPGVQPARQ